MRAAEQDRPDVAAARAAWAQAQAELAPERLVFIDETGTSTNMARLRGRAPRGERLVGKVPHGHWKTTTFVAGLRSSALTAPCVIDGPMNGNAFLAYVEQILSPSLKPDDIVVLDNLSAHKVAGVREAIEAAGARLLYLPPYSPDFNPIEQLLPAQGLQKPPSVPSKASGTELPLLTPSRGCTTPDTLRTTNSNTAMMRISV